MHVSISLNTRKNKINQYKINYHVIFVTMYFLFMSSFYFYLFIYFFLIFFLIIDNNHFFFPHGMYFLL